MWVFIKKNNFIKKKIFIIPLHKTKLKIKLIKI